MNKSIKENISTQPGTPGKSKPIIWIDHHTPLKRLGVKYFNQRIKNPKDARSESYWSYKEVNENIK